jgi:hypothetical protein
MVKSPIIGLDTKTYWLTDRQSQCDSDSDWVVYYEITNPQLSEENLKEKVKLVAGPRWAPDWPTDCRS